jgi:hypothetical protein
MVTNVYPSTVQNPSLLTNFANVKGTEGAVIDTTWYYDTPANTSLKWVNPGSVVGEGIKINAQSVTPSTAYTLDLIFNGSVSGKNMIANVYQSNGTTLITSKTFTTTGQPQIIPVSVSNPSGNISIIVTIVTNTTAQALTCHIDSVWLYTGVQDTYQTVGSGNFSATSTWDIRVPCDGMGYTINSGHTVLVDKDYSTLINGFGIVTNNGVIHFSPSVNTGLLLNGNLTGTGALYVAHRNVVSGFTLTTGKTYTYQLSQTVLIDSVEETLGMGYTQVSSITLVESTPSSFYYDPIGQILYIHTSDSSNPSTKTITAIDPIQRPAIGVESRCNIIHNATATLNNPIIQRYGWYPTLEYSRLNGAANLNATIIVLNDDLGLQFGDKIFISSGSEIAPMAESKKGVYTVSSYNSSTKTVTLTAGLQTARLQGDIVSYYSRTIKISRTSGTSAITPALLSNISDVGVNFQTQYVSYGSYGFNLNFNANHCTFAQSGYQYMYNLNVQNSLVTAGTLLTYAQSCVLNNIITANGAYLLNGVLYSQVNNLIAVNNYDVNMGQYSSTTTLIKNSDISGLNPEYCGGYFINTILRGSDYNSIPIYATTLFEFNAINCQIKMNRAEFFYGVYGKCYNCLFDFEPILQNLLGNARPPYKIIESFDHQQIVGNYKALTLGGIITTQTINSTPQPSKLIFNPTSTTAPVYRDFKFTVPANKLIKPFSVPVTLSALGMNMQLQIIDPANDPLIDSSASPLVTVNAANVTTAQNLSINYKSTVAKELILRVLCQAASGTVNVDVTQIMQSMAKPPMIVKR